MTTLSCFFIYCKFCSSNIWNLSKKSDNYIICEDSISHLLTWTQLAEESNALTVLPIRIVRSNPHIYHDFLYVVPRVSVSRITLQFTPTYVMTNCNYIIYVSENCGIFWSDSLSMKIDKEFGPKNRINVSLWIEKMDAVWRRQVDGKCSRW